LIDSEESSIPIVSQDVSSYKKLFVKLRGESRGEAGSEKLR